MVPHAENKQLSWVEPCRQNLRRQIGSVYEDKEEADKRAKLKRAHVAEKCSYESVIKIIEHRIKERDYAKMRQLKKERQ